MRRLALLLLSLLCAGAFVHAQETKKPTGEDDNPYTLEETVVYGDAEAPYSAVTSEYKAEELGERAVTSVADFLRSDPALSITTGAKAETETKIRGFSGFDILVLVDGHPLNPGYYGKVDLSMLPIDNIAKLQIIKGPASVAYGMNGMGGIVNIISKNGLELPKTVFDAEIGDHEFRKLSLNHSRRLGMMNYWVSGYEQYSAGFPLSHDFIATSLENGGLRDNSRYHKAGGNVKLGIDPGSNLRFALSLSYQWATKEIPTAIYSWASPTYRYFPSYERFSASASGSWVASPALMIKGLLFFDRYHDRLIDYTTPEMLSNRINYDSYLASRTVGATVELRYTLSERNTLHTGLQLKRDEMDKQPDAGLPYERHSMNGGYIFVQNIYQPAASTSITTGINAGYSSVESSGPDTYAVSPMLGISQKLFYKIDAHASFANVVRYPALHHLYSETSGNPALKPESANKFEVGLRRTVEISDASSVAVLECAFFYNSLHDLIYRASNSYRYQNVADAVLKGVELRTSMSFFGSFSADIAWVFLAGSGTADETMQEVSPQTLRLLLSWNSSFGFTASYEYQDYDARTTYLTTKILPAYGAHNIHVAQKLFEHIRLAIDVLNASDSHHEDELGYPAPGRQYVVGIRCAW